MIEGESSPARKFTSSLRPFQKFIELIVNPEYMSGNLSSPAIALHQAVLAYRLTFQYVFEFFFKRCAHVKIFKVVRTFQKTPALCSRHI